jgi:tetratricopeptide (TPR) repeat protein
MQQVPFPTVATASVLGLVLLLAVWTGSVSAQQSEAAVSIAHGILAYDDKRYAEALALFTDALKQDPENVEALYYLGLVHLAQQQPALAVESLKRALAKAPQDLLIRFQLGVAYFSLEQYDKAEPLLAGVFAEQPQLENLGYYVGFMRYRRKDYDGALRAFKSSRASDPTMQQLTKFYSGLALGILGLSERAVAEVDEALRLQPASPLTGPAERIRDSIVKAREGEQRLRAEIRLGGLYDDNVRVNPQRSTDPTAESLRNRQSRSFGELASVRVDYSWLRSGPWEATASYSFFQTVYHNDGTSAFNLQDHLGALGGFYRGVVNEMPYQLGLQYSYDWLTLGSNPFLERHAGTAFATLVENAANLTTLIGRLQVKNFLQAAETTRLENRDAKNWMIGPTHVFRFESDKHLIRIGYQFDYEDASGSDFTYRGHRALAGGQYTLPWGNTRLRYDYDVHFRYYPITNAVFPVTSPNTMRRRDTEQVHYFRIEEPLPNNFVLSVEYVGDFNQSNLAVFDYHRNTFSMVMTWTY